jgi:protein tyrosine phosphatase
MLSNLQEEGRKKCDLYWPSNILSPIVFEKFKITLENEDFILDKAVMQRNFIIHDEENCKKHNVTQLHVVCWPDHSIPEEESGYKAIDLLISYVDDYSTCYKSPIVTHCR